jgi:hypothetical protein
LRFENLVNSEECQAKVLTIATTALFENLVNSECMVYHVHLIKNEALGVARQVFEGVWDQLDDAECQILVKLREEDSIGKTDIAVIIEKSDITIAR